MARKIDELDDLNLDDFDYEEEESFSLESILAEYKGSAYIAGEKKTPADILDDEAEKIVREVLGQEQREKIEKSEKARDEKIEETAYKRVDELDDDEIEEAHHEKKGGFGHLFSRKSKHAKEDTKPEEEYDEYQDDRLGVSMGKGSLDEEKDMYSKSEGGFFSRRRKNVQTEEDSKDMSDVQEDRISGAGVSSDDESTYSGEYDSDRISENDDRSESREKKAGLGKFWPFNLGRKRDDLWEDSASINTSDKAETVGNAENTENTENGEEENRDASFVSAFLHKIKTKAAGLKEKSAHGENEGGYADADGYDDDDDEEGYIQQVNLADKIAGFLNRKSVEYKRRRAMAEEEYENSFEDEDEEPYIPEEEPPYKEETRRFIGGLASLALREMVILVIGIMAVAINMMFEMGVSIPLLGKDQYLITGVLLIMQLLAMALGIEVLISGVSDLMALKPGSETLIMFSAVINFVDGLVILLKKDMTMGLPYSVITICAIYFAVLGRKSYRLAMAESFKATVASSEPSAIVLDDDSIKGKYILKKTQGDLSGFWRMATSSDLAEDAFGYFSPVLMAASFLLALFSVFLKNESSIFIHSLASMLSVSASFLAVIAYGLPFRLFTKKMRSSGGVIAGWRGAVEICSADGALIVDSDIFPKGTVAMSGVKIIEGAQASRVIGYTGSIIMKSGSGLSDVFEDFMRTKGINRLKVDKFSFYEGGGLGGRVFSDEVLVGPAGFMNLMGVRIPNSIFERNAIYTAVNKKVAAAFSLSYTPSNSVRRAMISVLKSKISLFFAAKDANLTPNMLQQRFKVSVDGIEYIPIEDCYRISSEEGSNHRETLAVAYRSGLGPFASVISNSRKMVNLTTILTMIAVIGSVVGLAFVFLLCWSGTFIVNTPLNLLIYMMIIQAIAYLLIIIYSRR
mgnify:CR=1 FL=1